MSCDLKSSSSSETSVLLADIKYCVVSEQGFDPVIPEWIDLSGAAFVRCLREFSAEKH